tara:strand:+ start:1003 stop:1467 length:465 start_codon:yes stop_codon:yes gene_type:complete
MPNTPIVLNDLSPDLLEKDPELYLEVLTYLSHEETGCSKEELKAKLNETPYETWYSNHAFAVCRLVGKMNSEVLDSGEYDEGSYYGSSNPGGIDEDLAISILNKILLCGGDILAKDYYDRTPQEYLEECEGASLFYRVNNEKFKDHALECCKNE